MSPRNPASLSADPFPPRVIAPVAVRAAARTDRGLERPTNQDRAVFGDASSAIAFEPPAEARLTPHVFVGLVCDGMGGEAGGEVASRLSVETVMPFLRTSEVGLNPAAVDEWQVGRALVASIEAASEAVKAEGVRSPRLARMGSTATLAAVVGRTLLTAQVGDSRAYLSRRGGLYQITRDQTMIELLRASGNYPPGAPLEEFVGAHVILQAVGSSPRLEIPTTRTVVEPGDVVLLCSDGLTGPVDDERIRLLLETHASPESACDALIAAALEGGGPDNVTCIVFQILG